MSLYDFQIYYPSPDELLEPYKFEPELSEDTVIEANIAPTVNVSGHLGHTWWCICGSKCASMNLELENVHCGAF